MVVRVVAAIITTCFVRKGKQSCDMQKAFPFKTCATLCVLFIM